MSEIDDPPVSVSTTPDFVRPPAAVNDQPPRQPAVSAASKPPPCKHATRTEHPSAGSSQKAQAVRAPQHGNTSSAPRRISQTRRQRRQRSDDLCARTFRNLDHVVALLVRQELVEDKRPRAVERQHLDVLGVEPLAAGGDGLRKAGVETHSFCGAT